MAPLMVDATEASSPEYERPQPRPPKSPAHAAQIRMQNRRREWLERNPKYFDSIEHELADPLLYDALVRRFQSAEEREREGRRKGYGRVLEMDLVRGEARLSHLAQDTTRSTISSSAADQDAYIREFADAPVPRARDLDPDNPSSDRGSGSGDSAPPTHNTPRDVPAAGPEEGRARWDDFLRRRFVLGRDDEFDYRVVDEDAEYDAMERQEQENSWFDEEEPGWASESEEKVERPLAGETGVQDF
ncbi:hypothetical protein F5Y15DRAFT_412302 [Xylariaceae sp. FL0016]|nr:hypothetical protein F5Y15DRAFT_412302 [Xylariaceae sp. FL0016]